MTTANTTTSPLRYLLYLMLGFSAMLAGVTSAHWYSNQAYFSGEQSRMGPAAPSVTTMPRVACLTEESCPDVYNTHIEQAMKKFEFSRAAAIDYVSSKLEASVLLLPRYLEVEQGER
ncbi:hypothetical protein [Marinobacterium arenosum]|uniref:hypothetical protein n=1 Tax=Marinobacterium arenosum TaxID=2862496 RepID=UPI001C959B05|nr:hypothetical protein [Marinobacterium arenosum]MBY4676056.1 hypothetical protein [Marinobacterium arenosum]